jgi:hypothetical protein
MARARYFVRLPDEYWQTKVEVEFTFDLDPDHPDWPEVQSCQVMIPESDLPLHKDIMRRLRITPRALNEVFAVARGLAQELKPNQRIVADRGWRGRGRSYRGRSKDDFLVAPVRYSSLSDPLNQKESSHA